MPSTDSGRQKILEYLATHDIQIVSLAVKYDMKRQEVSNMLNGQNNSPQAHQFILRVIDDFKIR